MIDTPDTIRDDYDRVAPDYAAKIGDELAGKPFDRSLLDRFVALVAGTILDAGCGPGHVTRYLAERGADLIGLDLSSGMIAQARAKYPDFAFRVDSMTDLDPTSGYGGIVALYSIIHIPRDQQPAMFANWRAALAPGGYVLVSFHLGDEDRHLDEFFGHPVSLDFLFFTSDEVIARLESAGFAIIERHERDPYPDVEVATRRGYLIARCP